MSLGSCTAGLIAGNPVIPGTPKGAPNNPTNCGSMESNPVAVDGVLYTTNAPLGQVFAIDAATGDIIWTWTPSFAGETLNNGSAVQPRQRRSPPGVAVGEGLVFDGLPDGRLSRSTSHRPAVWETSVGSYKTTRRSRAPRSTSTAWSSPATARATAVATARRSRPSGRERRTHLEWSPIPSPGQAGYSTWTNNGKGGNGSTLYGGGAFWESPIVDPTLNLSIFGTGNPEPWNSRGPGKNLYTDSIVGTQPLHGSAGVVLPEVHHDVWDSDLPNNGVMFSAKYKVETKKVTRPAVAFVNKYGMTFVLDRVTGKPLLPIKESRFRGHVACVTTGRRSLSRHAERPVDPIGKDGIPCTTPDAARALTPFATATAPDASRSRSVARTPRTTRRSTGHARSR